MKSTDQIMFERQADTYFITFATKPRARPNPQIRQDHFDWFAANNLVYEMAAPRGWLGGNPGVYAVYFDGPNDSRVAAYTAKYEEPTGRSLHPDAYQMVLRSYQSWFRDGGLAHISGSEDKPSSS